MTEPASLPVETSQQVRDTCLCLHAHRAARALARRFDKALRPLGLTNTQFSLLMALNGPEPAPLGRVAALLGADRTTLTAALKPLARRGLAAIAQDPTDRRARRVSLTAAGHAVLTAALPAWRAAHEGLESELPGLDPGRLRAELRALSETGSPSD
ncbi:MAG TPA: MarR family winged helix-turn-helix transcriptional regulator [Phenylobacterium sp.]|uniref:MarR family winged helix-turn-helix transcriptional regulator n=1 Tax=Phenylobacterium sp. TaxID=1871053 RepID=UPI002CCFC9E5|nr:MarR family winged helix-turn-helix transcriptional regulator [Phenylobacterium sp.]HSV02787.1 MarR family winged helix-turn-helix transcriptional regulator [Phenylobacterium sp.]